MRTHRCLDCERSIHVFCSVAKPKRGGDHPGDSITWSQLCFVFAAECGLLPLPSSQVGTTEMAMGVASATKTTCAADDSALQNVLRGLQARVRGCLAVMHPMSSRSSQGRRGRNLHRGQKRKAPANDIL